MKIKRRIKILGLIFLISLILPTQGIRAQSLETMRELARIHYIRARNYYRKGAYAQAKEALEKVLELQPGHQGARWYLNFVQKELAKDDKSLRRRLRKPEEKRVKTVLDSFEKHSLSEEMLRAEKAQAKQLKRERAKLLKEKKQLRLELEKYKQAVARQKRKTEQIERGAEEKQRLRREAEDKRRQAEAKRQQEETRLRKEKKRQAQEERLAKLKAEKEKKRLRAEQERRIKEEARLAEKRRRAEQKALVRAQKELKLAKLKAEKEEKLRLRREAEEKARKEKRLMQDSNKKKKALKRTREQKELEKKIKLHYGQGRRHFQKKDYIAARKEFKDILILDPNNQYALNALEKVNATIAYEEKMYQRRKQEKEEAQRKQYQRIINQHIGRGKIYYYQERYQEAIEEFGKILSIDPTHPLAEKYILRCKKDLSEGREHKERRLLQERKAKEEALKRAREKLRKP